MSDRAASSRARSEDVTPATRGAAAPAAAPAAVWPWRALLGALAAVLVLAWAARGVDLSPWKLVRNLGQSVALAREFFPLNLAEWRSYLGEMVVTVQIALWGSALAVVAAVPLGLLAAGNVSPMAVRLVVRRLLDGLRAIHEMVFALLFVVAVGLGPFAGVLALAVHTTGILGKLFSEAVEACDPRPVEGVRATGGSRLDEVLYGVLPQVLPHWLGVSLYRFESNVRAATILGIVGAGGIGMPLHESLRAFDYPRAGTALLIILLFVVATDAASSRLRRLAH
ncbi:MAG: phosphonate ABC transporter, permease protein PhnE [Planctomycetota bacterium]